MTEPAASVIVPTFRRVEDALRCVASLAEQDVDGFEVIVVDNASDSELERRLRAVPRGAAGCVRYVAEPALGSHNARHAGARAARSRLLLFTDDDVRCGPGWVRSYVEAFRDHPELAAAGGPVEAEWLATPPEWLLTLVEQSPTFEPLALMEPHDRFVIPDRGFFYSANMAIRRDVLFELGGFNPDIFGNIWLGDGDAGLNRSVWAAGLAVAYVPGARVRHAIPPQRMTVSYMRLWMRNQGAADVYSLLHPLRFRRRGLLRLLGRTVREATPVWARAARSRRHTDPAAVHLQMSAARLQGRCAYLLRLLVDDSLWPLVRRERWLDS